MTRQEILSVAKPILYNEEMVRAILDDRKTETRRLLKPHPGKDATGMWHWRGCQWMDGGIGFPASGIADHAPYQPGDILYVRETWNSDWCDQVIYKADGGSAKAAGYAAEPKWRPSIHMPKEAARLFLRVESVRAERLQEITPEQAQDEGVIPNMWDTANESYGYVKSKYIRAFNFLWNSTIKPADLPIYGWDANPWVWAITFERVTPNG